MALALNVDQRIIRKSHKREILSTIFFYQFRSFQCGGLLHVYLVWMCGDSRRQFPTRYKTQISMIYILCSDEMRVLHPVSDVRTVLCNAMRMLCGYMRESRPIIKLLRDSGVECG